ncbi:sulfur carrier protein ThiS [Chloracidobacterium sp. D]|nr:sulfur carrier protein ThiS [Chloracidobacterium sp. D]
MLLFAPMTVTINGEHQTLSEPATLAELVARLGFTDARRIAIERNGELAPRPRWADIPVEEGDRIEIVHFVGGG